MRHLKKEIALCWRDSPVIRVIVLQALGPEFDSQNPLLKKTDMVAHICNLITGEMETGSSRVFAAQPAWPTW